MLVQEIANVEEVVVRVVKVAVTVRRRNSERGRDEGEEENKDDDEKEEEEEEKVITHAGVFCGGGIGIYSC